MNLIRLAINRPTAVISAVLMIVTFGIVALYSIPIQMTPDVRRPVIQIRTIWTGAAPAEVEREITTPIEEEMTGIEGVNEITSRSLLGQSRITLRFNVGQDMEKAFLLVSNRLIGISGLPAEARDPIMRTSGSDDRPIARLGLRRVKGNTRNIESYGDIINDVVVDRLERITGVSQVYLWGGSEEEMRIIIEPSRMAVYGLTVSEVLKALQGANSSISAGYVDEGKRRYVVRTESETTTKERAKAVVLRTFKDPVTGSLSRITVGDIATVEFGYKEPTSRRRYLGDAQITLNIIRDQGANVIDTMAGINRAMEELNEKSMPEQGLFLENIYDETIYIESAIKLVQQNIWVGGTLAAIILLLFLRSIRATLIITLSIPVSVIGTFVVMAALGRSINVISLAGIAFAVGMVVDAAIVVLENIFRHRQEGKPSREAAYEGAKQVWGAVLASALTTVVVFIPLIMLNLQVGQLFRDIAVAISVSVLLSLMVSITVIPALSNLLLDKSAAASGKRLRIPLLDELARGFFNAAMGFVRFITVHKVVSFCVVVGVCGLTAVSTFQFLPKLDYLPDGNRNFVTGRIQPPPGYNLQSTERVAEAIEAAVKPLWASETGPESEPGQPPKIKNFFFVAFRDSAFVGVSAVDPSRAGELVNVLRRPVFLEPGTRGFVSQSTLFGRAVGGSRSINLDVSGEDLDEIIDVARDADRRLRRALPRRQGNQVRPRPGLELGAPEIRVVPDLIRTANAGLSARDLGLTVDAFNDGIRVAEITVGGKRMDLMLQGPKQNVRQTQGINNLPVVTPSGTITPVSSLADVAVTSGPTEIRHLNRDRTVTLQIRANKKIPLEEAIEKIQSGVVKPIETAGMPDGMKLRLSGAADDLTKAWNAMKWSLLVAIIIVYLVIAVLFENFLYPFVILLSVPLATAGGIGGLAILNLFIFQALDMLTMLGFVILIGIVVNNAILLVDQALYSLRVKRLAPADAILAATRTRIRPIFMSTLTSVFGLLPLVLFPGAGSELYRGLGSVVVGGLALSAVLTLIIIPPLLSLFMRPLKEPSAPPASTQAVPGE
ncbi:MAG: efflux RND transporter permease subunit [Rhodospirillales bacterium]|nr:efflux RND transporter permease subunit [Rhodospirillales bacterium]